MTAPTAPQGTCLARPRPAVKAPRRLLAAAVMVALLAPGVALAQTAKERELEARVAQLERMVEQLLAAQDQTSATVAETQAQVTEVRTAQAAAPAAPAADDGKPRIQSSPIMTAASPGTTFSYGGMIKFDTMVTDTSDGRIADGGAGRMFYLPSTIPVGGPGADGGDAYFDSHAAFSRFWLGADHVTEGGDKVKALIEVDMFGGGSANLGNEASTNTHGVTVRHAYVSWNEWMAGQTWSNFMDVAALPEAVDFVGPTDGTIFVRQAQLRYSKGPWSFSIENPETTVTPYLGGAQFRTGDNSLPDVTARWITKGDWGHFSVAGMLRQYKYANQDDSGGAVSVSGRFNIGANDDIRYAVNAGSGIGRYLAFGLGSDVIADASGNIHALDGYGAFVAWRHAFTPKLRSNLMYSRAEFDNDKALTGFGVTEMAHSFHANLIYSPFPKLDIGAELIFGQRFLEDDREGDLSRLHTHIKYSF
ncbi:DcaP family trimeric outer membrane transporter [Luteimonas sp. A649]